MLGVDVIVQVNLVIEGFVAELTSESQLVGSILRALDSILSSKNHLHHRASLPLVSSVVVSVDDSHVADVALLVHQDLATLVTREPIVSTHHQVAGQVGGGSLLGWSCSAGWSHPWTHVSSCSLSITVS